MTTESWQVESTAAEGYEALLVPALMAAWAPRVVEAAGVQPGDRVLDIACGTGTVARTAADRAGMTGSVVGLDLNDGMLTVARRLRPDLDWRQHDATSLPFPDASFDRVLCQFGLMFFPDRLAALREMRRVLTPRGTAALTTWNTIDASPPYARKAEIVARLAGPDAAAIVRAPFSMHDPGELRILLEAAGFTWMTIATIQEPIAYPTIDAFLEGEFDATPLGAFLRAQGGMVYDRAKAETRDAINPFFTVTRDSFSITAHVITARAPGDG